MQQTEKFGTDRLALLGLRAKFVLAVARDAALLFQFSMQLDESRFARGEVIARRLECCPSLHSLARKVLPAQTTAIGLGFEVSLSLPLSLRSFGLRVAFVAAAMELGPDGFERLGAERDGGIALRHAFDAAFTTLGRGIDCGFELEQLLALLVQLLPQLRTLDHRDRCTESAQRRMQFLEPTRLASLDAQAADTAAAFLQQIGDPREVLVGALEFSQRFLLLQLEPRDAGGLLEDGAPRFRIGRQHRIDAPLLHHRVATGPEPGVEQHVAHVLEAHFGAVQQVARLLLQRQPARDVDLGATFEFALGILERDRHLRHAHGVPTLGALEDDVRHLRAAQALRSLVAQDPLDRIDDVRLAAAVGADDAGQSRVELELGTVGEGLESTRDKTLQAHAITPAPVGSCRRMPPMARPPAPR